MKTIAAVFLFFILTLLLPAQNNRYKIDDELSIEEIQKNVYLVVHSFPWAANSLVIKFDNGELLFVDTPYTPGASEKVYEFITKNDSNKRTVNVINTHFHIDNLGGNKFFNDIGADIYGSETTVKFIDEKKLGRGILDILKQPGYEKYYKYYKDMMLYPPNRIFDIYVEQQLKICGEPIEIFYPGPGHTEDNIVVYLPSRKILFGGCLIKSMESTTKGNTTDANLEKWAGSVQNVINNFPDAEIVIPGHGNTGGPELLDHTIEVVK